MLKIERILCPVDFSKSSAKAYDYAYSLAEHYRAKLFLDHVVQPWTITYPYAAFPESVTRISEGLHSDAAQQLQTFEQLHTPNGLHAERIVQDGTVTDSILAFAEERAIDLIVMGTHGRQGLDRLTMGSVTEKVLRKAHCPVLAVRKPLHDFVNPGAQHDPVQLGKIVLCSDFSDCAHSALEYALSLAMEYNAELTLLHVLEDIPTSTDLQTATTRVVRELEKPILYEAQNWCRTKSVVRVGKPYQEIIQLALEAQTDLIVMGVRGRNALDLALFGSTTHRVIRFGSCPVLAVHI